MEIPPSAREVSRPYTRDRACGVGDPADGASALGPHAAAMQDAYRDAGELTVDEAGDGPAHLTFDLR
jgi:hypothetical protein